MLFPCIIGVFDHNLWSKAIQYVAGKFLTGWLGRVQLEYMHEKIQSLEGMFSDSYMLDSSNPIRKDVGQSPIVIIH
jgi:hypothetical protein